MAAVTFGSFSLCAGIRPSRWAAVSAPKSTFTIFRTLEGDCVASKDVRVQLLVEGSTTAVSVQALPGLLLSLLPELVRDLTASLERMKRRENQPAGRKPL